MLRDFDRQIGKWYQCEEGIFEVVAWDEHTQTLEIQYDDGAVQELDLDQWDALNVMAVSPPEDWAAAFDDIEKWDLDEAKAAVFPEEISPLDRVSF